MFTVNKLLFFSGFCRNRSAFANVYVRERKKNNSTSKNTLASVRIYTLGCYENGEFLEIIIIKKKWLEKFLIIRFKFLT